MKLWTKEDKLDKLWVKERRCNMKTNGKSHKIFWLVFLTFLILLAGEYVIYRKVMEINQVVSEQFMQVKESEKSILTPKATTPTPRIILKK